MINNEINIKNNGIKQLKNDLSNLDIIKSSNILMEKQVSKLNNRFKYYKKDSYGEQNELLEAVFVQKYMID